MALKQTPLNPTHKKMGAKLVPFGGWEMPLQYTGIIQEHISTRTKAGLFDISHMGEIIVKGDGSTNFLEAITCNRVGILSLNQVQYNAIVNEKGGIVDDVTIYRLGEEHYFICTNASNYQKVFDHCILHNSFSNVIIHNESDSWHQIAIQGPLADEILSGYLGRDLSYILYYWFDLIPDMNGNMMIVSRTGYTGEDGFELYTTITTGKRIWNDLLNNYHVRGLVPVGLGARDTLRLEAKYPLYGNELAEDRTPVESGIGWIVKEKPSPYLGYERILKDKLNGPNRRMIGIELMEPGVIREACNILDNKGTVIGITTSGSFSPSLNKSIGLALLNGEEAVDEKEVLVAIRGILKKAILVKGPFIQGSVKKNK